MIKKIFLKESQSKETSCSSTTFWYLSYEGRYQRATPNKRVALSPAGKIPFTFRAAKSYQDCGLSVQSGCEVVRVFSQAIIIKIFSDILYLI